MRRPDVLVLPLLVLVGCRPHEEEAPKPVVDVQVAKSRLADVTLTVRAPAYIFAREQANVSARITAPIRKLEVRKGDTVAAGGVLAELDNRDLIAQREEAAAAVTDAEANLQRTAGGTLPTDIEKARGQVTTTEAALNQAQKIYDRRRQLFEQGAIPQRELLVSETELKQAKANYDVALRALDLLQNQSRDRDIAMAKSKVEQARARLSLIRAQLDFTEIRSPFAGSITEQFMYPGDMAKPDAPIFTVMDLSTAVARAQIPDAQAGTVRRDAACSFEPGDAAGASFAGRISVVNQSIDPARRTVESWCEMPNANRALRAGAFGQVVIVTAVARRSVVVPVAAVQFIEGTKKGAVMVAGDKGVAVRKEVETGEVFGGNVQITSGLAEGEPAIIQGAYGLPEGTKIRVQTAGEAAAPAAGREDKKQ